MRYFFVFISILLTFYTKAQLIVNNSTHNLQSETYFNPKYLKVNQIEKITGKVSFKKSLQPITEAGNIVQFVFDREGRLIEKIESFDVSFFQKDTASLVYKYNDINQLVAISNNQRRGFDATLYSYDSAGNVEKKVFARGKNLSQFKYQLEKGKQFFVKEEIQKTEKQSEFFELTTIFNNEGAPYIKIETEFDSLGNIASKTSRYVVTNKKHIINYKYNQDGKLQEINEYSNVAGISKTNFTFSYDDLGNIYEELKYKNGTLVQRRQFLYEDVSSLLVAELIKNEKTNEIKIIQFEYQFFDSVTKVDP